MKKYFDIMIKPLNDDLGKKLKTTKRIFMSTEEYYSLFGHPDADTPINDIEDKEVKELPERPF